MTLASDFGKASEVYNGFEVSTNVGFRPGAFIAGGLSTGRTVVDTCFTVDSPQAERPGLCRVIYPFGAQTTVQINGAYPLPWWDM